MATVDRAREEDGEGTSHEELEGWYTVPHSWATRRRESARRRLLSAMELNDAGVSLGTCSAGGGRAACSRRVGSGGVALAGGAGGGG